MTIGDALAWLDGHQNLERMLASAPAPHPDLARMRRLVDVLGHPEAAAPAIHVTGTNGKTSTSRAITSLLMTKGLSVGTYTSPHLERINERIAVNGEAIPDDDLAAVLTSLAGVSELVPTSEYGGLTWFELLTAAALLWFGDHPVDVMVIEVGIGGRWDATNVVDAGVAVVTNVGLDHTEFLGPTRAHVAREKAGIVKPGATLVLGETDPELESIFEAAEPDALWWAGRDYAVVRNDLAVGGRSLDLRTPGATYEGVWLDLHGRHQADNFAAGLVAVEAFFGAPLEENLVREAAGTLHSPGRLEVVSRHPLVVLDGAKNIEGARAAAAAVSSDFGSARSRILVFGMLVGKDPAEMLEAIGVRDARLVVLCPPPSPRAVPTSVLAEIVAELGIEGLEIVETDSAADGVEAALAAASPEDLILVGGSLYVAGAARAVFAGSVPSSSLL
jgi:dihydrofolate synthase / folylpolyglutamate synthase